VVDIGALNRAHTLDYSTGLLPPAALKASASLEDKGFLAVAIPPPAVPEGTARLRVTFNAAQPDDEIERLAGLVRNRILS
jgi:7-keto-8-aminopelargonate synthetase-like enzyme